MHFTTACRDGLWHATVFNAWLTVKADGSWTSRPLEDMYPFLPREVLLRNLLIEPLDSL